MNDNNDEVLSELQKVKENEELIKIELENAKKKWIEYALKCKDDICKYQQPIVVKKKFKYRISDMFNSLLRVFGFTKNKKYEEEF